MLIRSISGVRGLTSSHLTPELSVKYARALHLCLPEGAIAAGKDSRPSGDIILSYMINELVRLGRTIIVCDIVPTPTVQFIVHSTEAIGGFIVTASHNPTEWNGLKFLRADSTFFYPNQCERLFQLVDENHYLKDSEKEGFIWHEKNAIQKHIISCASLGCIDLNRIQRKKFRVVIDAVNGGGADALPALLESLGCEVIKHNCEPNGEFTRGTEPLPENIFDLCELVQKHNADVGFAVDPDADRLALVNELGEPLGEEYTLVLATNGYLYEIKEAQTFVTNLSTTMALDKLAESKGSMVIRSAVGEINVVRKMNETNSDLGGEGNGGVILREAHLGRDSLVAATMILNCMSQTDKSLGEIYKTLPKFKFIKDKVDVKGINLDLLNKKVTNLFKDVEKNTLDGIKFTWEDKWIHLRKSNTEPIMRIYAEAKNYKDALNLITQIKKIL